MLSYGWRRAVLMMLAGAIGALSMPPLFILLALFIALPMLVWALDGAEHRDGVLGKLFGPAFRIGFFFGLGYFLAAIHWIGAAFFVDGGWMLVAMPFAVLALAAGLAIFWAFGIAFAHLFWSTGTARIFALAAGLSLAEFARGTLFTGFPFDLLGYALTANVEMMQAASLVGVYGLTVVAILIAATPALVWPAADRSLVTRLVPLFAAIAVIAVQIGWGYQRVQSTAVVPQDGMVMRIVQPVIPQDVKWQAFAREETVTRLIDLSTMRTHPEDQGLDDVTHLVWPEAALPFFLSEEPEYLARIARALPDGIILLSGAPREPYGTDDQIVQGAKPYNSIFAFNSEGEVISSYDKTHLVPFGEFLPFDDQLRAVGFSQMVAGTDGWAHGDARRLMTLPGTPPFLPLICYEAIYSGGLGATVENAEFIFVVTNDAWFDGSFGISQLFHHSRVRTVEEGLAMVRAANSGISAIIDPLGRITARMEAGKVGAIKGTPAQPIAKPLFAQVRHVPFYGLAAACALIGLGGFLAGRNKRRKRR
ncbi:apolipoprotein N-acyltransferase [Pelagibacterium halotolerans]|uniref:apolipoprotein N-acyltransferase n=1 Tax=Pelagibacterium halotolerans TaxID=531813 RepID=UPI00384ECCF4